MALKPLQFRVSDDDHAYLQAQSVAQNRAMGRVLGDDIANATIDDIAKAIITRFNRGEVLQPPKKKTQLLLPPASLEYLSRIVDTTALQSDVIIRLIIESKRLN